MNALDKFERRQHQLVEGKKAKAAAKEARELKKQQEAAEAREKAEKEAAAARKKAEKEAAAARKKAEKDAARAAAFWREMEDISANGKKHPRGYLGYLDDKKKDEIWRYREYSPTEAEMTVLGWLEEGYRMLYRWNWLLPCERAYFDRMAALFPA
jgi:hypothetical protein